MQIVYLRTCTENNFSLSRRNRGGENGGENDDEKERDDGMDEEGGRCKRVRQQVWLANTAAVSMVAAPGEVCSPPARCSSCRLSNAAALSGSLSPAGS